MKSIAAPREDDATLDDTSTRKISARSFDRTRARSPASARIANRRISARAVLLAIRRERPRPAIPRLATYSAIGTSASNASAIEFVNSTFIRSSALLPDATVICPPLKAQHHQTRKRDPTPHLALGAKHFAL